MNDFLKLSSAWFAGPKAENRESFTKTITSILEDYYYWRRNYFPEDGVVITSSVRRANSEWNDTFEDKLNELLAALKGDNPFQSPRYAAHMVAEQTLPSIAAYFAGLLYNPNNVSTESAPVTVRLENEASQMIAEMLGYNPATSWAHLTGGGTVANMEAMWVARTVKYLPFVLKDIVNWLGLSHRLLKMNTYQMLALNPQKALALMLDVFDLAEDEFGSGTVAFNKVIEALQVSEFNVMQVGMADLIEKIGSKPVLLVPESNHYSFPKGLDILGIGRRSVVKVKVDNHFRMDIDDLEKKLDQVDAAGQHVLMVVGVVGTTEEGAVDPVHKIQALRKKRENAGKPSFWIHGDAAYGGYLRTTIIPERMSFGKPETEIKIKGNIKTIALAFPQIETCDALEKLGECDSITIDPHKLGYIPYPAGAICFKSNIVRPLLRQHAPYIESSAGGPRGEMTSPNIGVYILEGSKPGAAAASVWLSHKTIPLNNTGHGQLMKETIRNACELHALLEQWPTLSGKFGVQAVPICPPGSNIVCYAFKPTDKSVSLAFINKLNEHLYRKFSLPPNKKARVYEQRFFVSRTVLSVSQYSIGTGIEFLKILGVSENEYKDNGVFLLRSALMNPWYSPAKEQGRHFLSALVSDLYKEAYKFCKHEKPNCD